MRIRYLLLLALTIATPLSVHAALQAVDTLPAPRLVEQNREMLLAQGCVERTLEADGVSVDVPEGWQHIAPRDWQVGQYMFCSEEVAMTLTQAQGQVLGLLDDPIGTITGAIFAVMAWALSIFFVTPVLVLMRIVSEIVAAVLASSTGLTDHLFVRTGFPFVLQFVNLGFLVALLVMAVMVILRAGEFNLRRTLPRLLIAALLVNFSLVFAKALLDVSTLAMAAMRAMLGAPSMHTVGEALLQSTSVFTNGFRLDNLPGTIFKYAVPRWNPANTFPEFQDMVKIGIASLVAFGLLIGVIVLAVALFMRAVMLILLLIVAPVPYVLMIFPATNGLARRWWEKFLKYVFLGPILFFILILMTRAQAPEADFGGGVFSTLVTLAITVGLLIGGSIAGLQLSAMFGGGIANNVGKGAARWLWKSPLGKAALYTSGAGAALGAARGAREVGKGVWGGSRLKWARQITGTGEYAKYDAKGRPIKGRPSYMQSLGQRVGSPELARAARATTEAQLPLETLIKPKARYLLREDAVNSIIASGNTQKISALIQDADFVDNKMTGAQKAAVMANPLVREQFLRTLRTIAQREDSADRK